MSSYSIHLTKLYVNYFLQDFEYLSTATAKTVILSPETPTHTFFFNSSRILVLYCKNVMNLRDMQRTMSLNVYARFSFISSLH